MHAEQHGHDAQVEASIRAAFQQITLSQAQRQRLLQCAPAMNSGRHHMRMRRVIVAIALVGLVLASYVALTLRDAPPVVASVEAAGAYLAPPAAGSGRHRTVDVQRGSLMEVHLPASWRADIWERTLADGTQQVSVRATGVDGTPLSTFISSGSAWQIEWDGHIEQGQGSPLAIPPESAVGLVSPEMLRAQLAQMDLRDVETRRSDDLDILVVSISPDSDSSLPLSTVDAQMLQVEIAFSRASGDIVWWRNAVIDTAGQSHLLWELIFVANEDPLTVSAIPDALFAMAETGEGEIASGPRMPQEVRTTSGVLAQSSYIDAESGGWRVIYTGPGGGVLSIDIYPSPGTALTLPADRWHQSRVGTLDVWWQEDPQADWPRSAVWDNGTWRFNLSVLHPLPGWSEADLLRVVQSLP